MRPLLSLLHRLIQPDLHMAFMRVADNMDAMPPRMLEGVPTRGRPAARRTDGRTNEGAAPSTPTRREPGLSEPGQLQCGGGSGRHPLRRPSKQVHAGARIAWCGTSHLPRDPALSLRQAGIEMTLKQNENYLRCIYRCNRPPQPNQCGFFQWTHEQPLKETRYQALRTEVQREKTYTARELLCRMVQTVCPHPFVSHAGTNAFVTRRRCSACQKLLQSIRKDAAEDKKKAAKKKVARPGHPRAPTTRTTKNFSSGSFGTGRLGLRL